VIDENGRMMENTGKYAGMKTKEAREAIVEDMQAMGLIDHIDENYEHNIATCYRCGGQIEPIPSKQWFVKMKPLAEKAKKAVESGEIEIMPKRFEKVYFHWMDNIRDWCISRQLWWGHQIPVWYKGEEVYVGKQKPEGEGWVQEEDVLDTWFSSGLWPFSTLGWPDTNAKDYKYFYPTTVMETGYDILFFWVARMIMMGIELTGKVPFETVYLHGLVRDEKNRKMSKSLGNGIDPIVIQEKYGADALRMALVVGATPGNDIPVGENKIRGYRNFSNKIWNISRFVISNLEQTNIEGYLNLTDKDEQDLKTLDELSQKISKLLDEHKFSQAGEHLYEYTWHEFADKIIEQEKERLYGSDEEEKKASLLKLSKILITILKMLHPFTPFVTEACWQELPDYLKEEELLIKASWPK
jgi:valyl-tRNA synthetase